MKWAAIKWYVAGAILVLLALLTVAALFVGREYSEQQQEASLQEWVEKQNYVFLTPARSGIMPGDIVLIPPPRTGGGSSGSGLQLFQRSRDVLGPPERHRLFNQSEPFNYRVNGSIDAAVRAGLLTSQAVVNARAGGAERFDLDLADVVTIEMPLRQLQQAIARDPELVATLRGNSELAVIYSVLRPSRFRYQFYASGETGFSARLRRMFSIGSGGRFNSGTQFGSDHPLVIGYAIARINLPDGDGPARPQTVRVEPLPYQSARALQTDGAAKLWPLGTTLRVQFLGGTPEQQNAFRAAMAQWLQSANLRTQEVEGGPSDVRVSFSGDSNWSFIGTDGGRVAPDQPTITLEGGAALPSAYLHEIGHVLGLVHEHQNPSANLPWDREAVYAFFGQRMRWPRQTIDLNIFASTNYPGQRAFDPQSIMNLAFDPSMFTNGQRVGPGNTLSASDRAYIAQLYPRR